MIDDRDGEGKFVPITDSSFKKFDFGEKLFTRSRGILEKNVFIKKV